LTSDAALELVKLQEDRDAAYSQLNDEEDEEDSERPTDDEIYERIEEIDNRIRSIQHNRKRAYTEDVKATCGVVVSATAAMANTAPPGNKKSAICRFY
jgi:hypothetical protein